MEDDAWWFWLNDRNQAQKCSKIVFRVYVWMKVCRCVFVCSIIQIFQTILLAFKINPLYLLFNNKIKIGTAHEDLSNLKKCDKIINVYIYAGLQIHLTGVTCLPSTLTYLFVLIVSDVQIWWIRCDWIVSKTSWRFMFPCNVYRHLHTQRNNS